MERSGRSGAAAFKLDARLSGTQHVIPAQNWRVRRLIDALQVLDDRTLSQIGIERGEIERFAQTEAAHRL